MEEHQWSVSNQHNVDAIIFQTDCSNQWIFFLNIGVKSSNLGFNDLKKKKKLLDKIFYTGGSKEFLIGVITIT